MWQNFPVVLFEMVEVPLLLRLSMIVMTISIEQYFYVVLFFMLDLVVLTSILILMIKSWSLTISMKATEQYFLWHCLLCCTRWFYFLSPWMKSFKLKLLSTVRKFLTYDQPNQSLSRDVLWCTWPIYLSTLSRWHMFFIFIVLTHARFLAFKFEKP